MELEKMLVRLLDSWNQPIVYVDTNHIIRYMNSQAKTHYGKWGDVIGKSIFDCHNEASCKMIQDIFFQLENGAEEVLFVNSEKHRVYMRSIRDEHGKLQGYFERYEPPLGK
jgi:DUF438 domain-containing protein